MNPYQELGLDPSATAEQIRQQYKILAQQHHPDKGGDEERFKRIKAAYEILIDPERRAQYDATGEIRQERSVRSEAMEQLAVVLNQFLQQINEDHDDLILMMKNDINRGRTEIEHHMNKIKLFTKKLEKILKKIRRRGEGENIIKGFIEQQIEQCRRELEQAEKKLKVVEAMREIIDDYQWGLEELLLASSLVSEKNP